jgi:hypothetical protein
MADDESKPAATADTKTVSSITTKSQKQKAAIAAAADASNANNTTDDNDKSPNYNNHKKEREVFKGKSDKMGGNVLQLAAEGRKANQYTLTTVGSAERSFCQNGEFSRIDDSALVTLF